MSTEHSALALALQLWLVNISCYYSLDPWKVVVVGCLWVVLLYKGPWA